MFSYPPPDGVHQEVQVAVFRLNAREERLDLCVLRVLRVINMHGDAPATASVASPGDQRCRLRERFRHVA